MRYAIRRGAWRPLLALFGANQRQSFVQLDEQQLTVRFGSFSHRVPREDIAYARAKDWPWLCGIGWRLGGRSIALIGSAKGVVEIGLRRPHRERVVFVPYTFERLYVSLEDPQSFLAEVEAL